MGLFGRKPKVEPVTAPAQEPTHEIRFDPGLVTSLQNDHIELEALYTRIDDLLGQGKYSELPAALVSFKTRLQSHIMVENVRFYVYLEKRLGGDQEDTSTMHDFRREMNGIAHKVVAFTKKYSACGVSEVIHGQFEAELKGIGTILEQRLRSEESDLYPLYRSMG